MAKSNKQKKKMNETMVKQFQVNNPYIIPKSILCILAMICIAFMSVLISHNAQGAGINTKYTKPLFQPSQEQKSSFDKDSKKISQKFYGAQALTYSFNLPNDWEFVGEKGEDEPAETVAIGDEDAVQNNHANQLNFGVIAEYIAPFHFEGRPYVEIEVFDVQQAIGAFHWMYQFLIKNGVSIEAVEYLDWQSAQATYVVYERGNGFRVRTKVLLRGANMIKMSYFAPVSNADKFKLEQANVVNSFAVSNTDQPTEKIKDYEAFSLAKFNFFDAWIFKVGEIDGVQSISVNFTKESDRPKKRTEDFLRIDGVIELRMIEQVLKPDLVAEIKNMTKNAEKSGYILGDLIENIDIFTTKDQVETIGIEAYKLIDETGNRIDHELWVAILKGVDYFYLITLDSPSRADQYQKWAHNVAAFKQLVESVEPL